MIRTFIAIDIKVVKKIIEILEEIEKCDANIKLLEPEKLHITLKFLGDTEKEKIEDIKKIIKQSIKDIKPFKIKLANTGVFPNKNYIKVLWIGIKNPAELIKISEKINVNLAEIGFNVDKRKFSPHLTIARLKSAKNKDKILNILKKYENIEFCEFKVNSIKLMKSELTSKGPIYTTLKETKI